MQLFEQTARLVQADFSLEASADDVARICRLVDGLPLAIVISAGWVQFLSPETIANRIEENLDFLTISRRDLPERHRGITALMNSTWASLGEQERRVMQKLTVFRGDFSLESAEKVAEATLLDLMALVSKSMLQTTIAGRYQQHELLRRYAQERAIGSRVIAQAQQAHTAYFREWLQELQQSTLPPHERFIAIDNDYHNLWLLDHLSDSEQHQQILSLTNLMQDYWMARGFPLSDGVEMIESALPFAKDNTQKIIGQVRLGNLYVEVSRFKVAVDLLIDTLEPVRKLTNLELEATALNGLVKGCAMQGQFDTAIEYLFPLIRLCENASESEDHWSQRLLAIAYLNLGIIYSQTGDNDKAEEYAGRGLAVTHRTDDMLNMALCHNSLGIVELEREQYDAAQDHFTEALGIAQDIEHTRFQTIFAGNLAECVYKQGDYNAAYRFYIGTLQSAYRINNLKTALNMLEQLAILLGLSLDLPDDATVIYGASQALREQLGIMIEPRQKQTFDNLESGLQGAINADAYHGAIENGRQLSVRGVIDYLKDISPGKPVTE